jgi:hypothetical protein
MSISLREFPGSESNDEAFFVSKQLIHEYGYTQVWKVELEVDTLKRISVTNGDGGESSRQNKTVEERPDIRVG